MLLLLRLPSPRLNDILLSNKANECSDSKLPENINHIKVKYGETFYGRNTALNSTCSEDNKFWKKLNLHFAARRRWG